MGDRIDDFFTGKNDPRQMPWHFFWKVRRDYASAQRADISKQNFSMVPRFWYIDCTVRCGDCDEEFVFSANEQRFWYEEMKFYVDSFPRRCITCRKKRRTNLELRKKYDASIEKALGHCTVTQKKEMVSLINELEGMAPKLPKGILNHRAVLMGQIAKRETKRVAQD